MGGGSHREEVAYGNNDGFVVWEDTWQDECRRQVVVGRPAYEDLMRCDSLTHKPNMLTLFSFD